MTQVSDAADRAQEIKESYDQTTTAAANESLAQVWLDAEETEKNAEIGVASSSRLVATLPDWSAFSGSTDGRREIRDWRALLRDGALRTSGVALAAFGLGVFCASGWLGGEEKTNDSEIAFLETEKGSGVGVGDENLLRIDANEANEADGGALTTINSATLRSVPNAASVDLFSQPSAETGVDLVSSAVGNAGAATTWGNGDGGASTGGVGAAASVGWGELNVSTNGDAERFDAATVVGADAASNESRTDDSSWRRGVDFQRDLQTPNSATANVEPFPTWDDLEANANANAPIASAAGATPNAAAIAGNGAVAENYSLSENVALTRNSNAWAAPTVAESAGYAAYNDNAGYRNDAGTNLNTDAPQYAGNSQISGYNQSADSENFAGLPNSPAANTVPNAVPVASYAPSAAPVASYAPSAAPVASYAPSATAETSRAMVAQVPDGSAPVATPNVPAANPSLRW